ncbi:MAG: DNA-3-methyladenine glycosylase [Flexilinea sp.]
MTELIRLTKDSQSICHLSSADPRMKYLIETIGEIEIQKNHDPYLSLVETIIGQMLSNKVADVLIARLTGVCGGRISPQSISGLTVPEMRAIGLSNAKSAYILNLTEAVNTGKIDLDSLKILSDEEVMKTLTSLRGIGSWSAKMHMIFVLCREDILPFEDGAFLQAYTWLYDTKAIKPAEISAVCEIWRPYSSIAARYLYKAQDMGMTKIPFTAPAV